MRIEPELVESELKAIDGIIDEIGLLCNNINSDIRSAWNSETARAKVMPKIDDIKLSISNIKNSIGMVRARAQETVEATKRVDESV